MIIALLAQATLLGVVVGDSGGTPLPGAIVELEQLRRSTTADARGAFEFTQIAPGKYRVRARAIGYQARALDIALRKGEPTRVVLQLTALPVVLEPVTVEAEAVEAWNPRMRGFTERRKALTGHFLGPAELTRLENTDLPGVLRLFHVPIRRTARTNRPYAAARPGRSPSREDACPVQVFMDGHMMSNQLEFFDISSVRVANLAGLEYYESLARIPIEYDRGDSRCGVLVLWTRTRKP